MFGWHGHALADDDGKGGWHTRHQLPSWPRLQVSSACVGWGHTKDNYEHQQFLSRRWGRDWAWARRIKRRRTSSFFYLALHFLFIYFFFFVCGISLNLFKLEGKKKNKTWVASCCGGDRHRFGWLLPDNVDRTRNQEKVGLCTVRLLSQHSFNYKLGWTTNHLARSFVLFWVAAFLSSNLLRSFQEHTHKRRSPPIGFLLFFFFFCLASSHGRFRIKSGKMRWRRALVCRLASTTIIRC